LSCGVSPREALADIVKNEGILINSSFQASGHLYPDLFCFMFFGHCHGTEHGAESQHYYDQNEFRRLHPHNFLPIKK
jgi:hypothetical protein